jgi:hypothetical protein
MKKTIIYLLFFLLFISCKDDFIIDINSKKISKKEIKVTITTNFPENTIFSITAERIYKRKNNENYYGGTHYYSSEYGIKNGKLEFKLKINDSVWISNYNQYRKDEKLTEIDYKSIKDSIEISVVYSPKFLFNQKSNVKKILGENGENIRGKGTIKMDGIKVFEKSIKIFSKFEQ